MLVDDGGGDRDDLVVLAKGKSTHHEVFLGRTSEFLHSGGTPGGPRLIANVTEGVSSPPSQGVGERADRGHMIAPSRLEVRLVQLLLEESGIDLARTRNERISRCFGSDSIGPELITQQRDVGRQGGPHTFSRRWAPDVIDQPIERNDPIGHQEQAKDKGTAPLTGNPERLRSVVAHLERTQNGEVHGLSGQGLSASSANGARTSELRRP